MINIIKEVKLAKKLYDGHYADDKEAQLYFELLKDDLSEYSYKCLLNIGSVAKIIDRYNLKFGIGTTLSQCRVDLHKKHWKYSIHPSVNQAEIGVWTIKPIEEIYSIYAYHFNLGVAVGRCLYFAKKAGVI